MSVYYLGAYDATAAALDLASAAGPFPIDLGDIFYAPNTLACPASVRGGPRGGR